MDPRIWNEMSSDWTGGISYARPGWNREEGNFGVCVWGVTGGHGDVDPRGVSDISSEGHGAVKTLGIYAAPVTSL